MKNSPVPSAPEEITLSTSTPSPRYPEKIPESQGDLADRANAEIEEELLEEIERARRGSQSKI